MVAQVRRRFAVLPGLALAVSLAMRLLLIGFVTLAVGCGFFVQKKDPLIVAASDSDMASAKRLVEGGADVNQVGKRGSYPLLQAVGRSEEMVRYLLSKGATPNRPKGGFNAPICVALLADNPMKFSSILIEAGAKLDIVCHNGQTPLGFVAGNGEPGQILQLLTGNASIDFRNESGYTPLKSAASTKRAPIMRMLLTRGASPLELSWTELMPAIGTGADLWKRFSEVMPHVREPSAAQLQKVSAEVSAHAAAQFVEIRSTPSHPLNLVLKAGKSPNEVDENGVTALEAAWRAHQPAVAAILLASGARGAAVEATKSHFESHDSRETTQISR